MKKVLLTALALTCYCGISLAQTTAEVKTVVTAEENFNKLLARKGIKDAFLEVADPEGIVFRPNAVKITEFYGGIDKQPGTLKWTPKFARISANGDLAFTAGPYIYQNGKKEEDKVHGEYVSVWRMDLATNKLKLLIDLGIQHPEPEQTQTTDFKDPDPAKKAAPSKDPFNGKNIIIATDKTFNHSLSISALATYKEFFSAEGRFYFPGFEPMTGQDRTLKFLANQGISISAETTNAGRSSSGDLAYSYGRARIKKGNVQSDYNYVRIWEVDAQHRWNVLLEIFSAVEKE